MKKRIHPYMSVIFAVEYTNPHLIQSQPLTVPMNLHLGRVQTGQPAPAPFSINWGNTRVGTGLTAGGLNFSHGLHTHVPHGCCQLSAGNSAEVVSQNTYMWPRHEVVWLPHSIEAGVHEQVFQEVGSGAALKVQTGITVLYCNGQDSKGEDTGTLQGKTCKRTLGPCFKADTN